MDTYCVDIYTDLDETLTIVVQANDPKEAVDSLRQAQDRLSSPAPALLACKARTMR